MKTEREQKLVDICFQVAIVAADHLHGKSNAEIAAWVAEQLELCGFPTKPMGISWGVLHGATSNRPLKADG